MLKSLLRYESWIMLALFVAAFVVGGLFVLNRFRFDAYGWQTNFARASVPLDDITVGGRERDDLAPVNKPIFVPAGAALQHFTPETPVIVVEQPGAVHAYPLSVLLQHGIVNDTIGGQPIAVTFCPLCHSPIVYNRRIMGEVVQFGASGNLYMSNLVMWDDVTESWWMQFSGEAIVGDYTGTLLDVVPTVVVSLDVFRSRYPDGQVMVGDADHPGMTYQRNPYIGYDTNPQPFMFFEKADPRYMPTGRVLGVALNNDAVAYAFSALTTRRTLNDTVGDVPVVVFWMPGAVSVLDDETIADSRDVGMATVYQRVVTGRTLTFTHEDGLFVDEQTGSTWNIFGEAVQGPLNGQALTPVTSFPSFWFAWAKAYPDTRLVTLGGDAG